MRLEWDGCFNVRDLGGLPCRGGGVTRQGVLVRSDDLGRATRRGAQALLDYGIRTVVDLRNPEEQGRFRFGRARSRLEGSVARVAAPMLASAPPEAQQRIRSSTVTVETYVGLLSHCRRGIADAVRGFASAGPGGVVIHCAAGRDRTGIVVALLLSACGVADPIVAADYAESAIELGPLYVLLQRAAVGEARRAALARENRSEPEDMLRVLEWLHAEHAGATGYLLHAGLSSAEVGSAVARLSG